MNDDPRTTVEQTTLPARRGRPPKVKTQSIEEHHVERPQDSTSSTTTADAQVLKISDMPKPEPQNTADNEKDKLIDELKGALTPFAKISYEPSAPPEKILYRLNRGDTVDITNSDIIKARTVLGMM